MDAINQFQEAIAASGLAPPNTIYDDGAIHRFSSNGKRGDDSGWYSLHTDGIPAGSFGCWREGLQSTWSMKSDSAMTPAEVNTHRARIKAIQVKREEEEVRRQQEARDSAASLLQQADSVGDHPYLTDKGIQPHGIKVFGDNLLIPLRDTAGVLHSLQTIGPDGTKRFHPGGRVAGCYYAIGKPSGVLMVCEGFATGASLQEATGHAVAVAFNAGNLKPVALALRAKYPALEIIVAADDDHLTDGNPGLTKARAAAQAVGGVVAISLFPADRADKATDFNDLHALAGAAAVKACIDTALESTNRTNGGVAAGQMDLWPEPTPLPSA